MYSPLSEMDPTFGLKNQVTSVAPPPLNVAVNCWVCEADSETPAGLTRTETVERRLITAENDFVGSATLVAIRVTV